MKNIQDLLIEKEAELQRVQREVEAIRIVARLLGVDDETATLVPISGTAGMPLAAVSRAHKDNGHGIANGTVRQFP